MMKKQIIVLTFNGVQKQSENTKPEAQVTSFHPISSPLAYLSQKNSIYQSNNHTLQKPIHPTDVAREIELIGNVPRLFNIYSDMNQKDCAGTDNPSKKTSEGDQEVDNPKNRKEKKIKAKSKFEIKNVLQQICSSIQNCLKDGYIPKLTEKYWSSGNDEGLQNKQMIKKMQSYLDNPSEHNISALLKMNGNIQLGLKEMFVSRILKKYIQCSKIRTLEQKAICLEAVDYLYRCFREQQLCSLHTWAHQREQKIMKRNQKFQKSRQKAFKNNNI